MPSSCTACTMPMAAPSLEPYRPLRSGLAAIIAAHPNLKGLYGTNEGAAIGVVHAVQELGIQGKLAVVGFDSGKDQIDAIRSGLMAGAITQNPVGIGKEVVINAMKAIKGESLPKVVDTGYYWYDKTNIDDPKIQAVLYK